MTLADVPFGRFAVTSVHGALQTFGLCLLCFGAFSQRKRNNRVLHSTLMALGAVILFGGVAYAYSLKESTATVKGQAASHFVSLHSKVALAACVLLLLMLFGGASMSTSSQKRQHGLLGAFTLTAVFAAALTGAHSVTCGTYSRLFCSWGTRADDMQQWVRLITHRTNGAWQATVALGGLAVVFGLLLPQLARVAARVTVSKPKNELKPKKD
ncbi:MAG: hypothetical protein MHM6MM_008357 [Cercozoa sp. M6MM]